MSSNGIINSSGDQNAYIQGNYVLAGNIGYIGNGVMAFGVLAHDSQIIDNIIYIPSQSGNFYRIN